MWVLAVKLRSSCLGALPKLSHLFSQPCSVFLIVFLFVCFFFHYVDYGRIELCVFVCLETGAFYLTPALLELIM